MMRQSNKRDEPDVNNALVSIQLATLREGSKKKPGLILAGLLRNGKATV